MATASIDPEFQLAEVVGEALGETVRNVKRLVDLRIAEQEARYAKLEADFKLLESEQIGQTKALWDRANEVGASIAERTEALRRELDVRQALAGLSQSLSADKAAAVETAAAFSKSIAEMEAARQAELDRIGSMHRTELEAAVKTMTGLLPPPLPDLDAMLRGIEERLMVKLEAVKAELRAELDPARWIAQLGIALREMPAPLMQPTFQVPEVPVTLQVSVPPPRLVEKRHEYDQYNRPVRTVEIEIKADGE